MGNFTKEVTDTAFQADVLDSDKPGPFDVPLIDTPGDSSAIVLKSAVTGRTVSI